MIPDETIKLILDMGKSGADAKEVAAALQQLKTTAKEVATTYDLVSHATETYAIDISKLDTEIDHLISAMAKQHDAQGTTLQWLDAMETKTIHVGAAATGAVGTKTAGGRGMLGFSYAVQDFTSVLTMGGNPIDALPRALMSISNNIDQMGMAAGMSAAKAAALSIGFTGMVVALPGLISLFKDLWLWMGAGPKGPAPVLDAMDKVADRLKTIKENIEGVMKSKTTQEKETEGLRKEYFAEAGGEKMVNQLAAAIGASGKGEQPTAGEKFSVEDLARRIADAQAKGFQTGTESVLLQQLRRTIRQRLAEANRQRAGTMVGEAAGVGPGAAAAQQMIGQFMPGVGADLAGLDPAARAQQEEDVARAEEQGRKLHEAGQRRREQQKLEIADQQAKIQNRERTATEEQRTRDDHLKDSVKLGRDVGKVFEKKNEEGRVKPAKLDKIPMMPLNASDLQADQVAAHTMSTMIHNEMMLAQKVRMLEQANRNAMRVNRELVTSTQSPLPK